MRDNFIICIQAVIPMFIFLVIGLIARKAGAVKDSELPRLNNMAFKVLFPFLMFSNVYKSKVTEVFNVKLIAFAVIAVFIVYFAGTVYTRLVEADNKARGAMIQGIYRSNFVIMGLPLANNIFGHGNIGITAVTTAVVVPLYNVLAVITLEKYRDGKADLKTVLINIAKNPLIIGAVIGILFSVLGIRLPGVLDNAVSDVSACATPVALMILGASFKFDAVKEKKKNIIRVCIARLVLVPGIVLTTAYFMGFTGISFVTLVGVFAAPCAISSFTMAQAMESDYELAGAAVIFTSAICCFTMFLWLFIFRTIGAF